jgi:3-polyprenyl-4-hydroxybenzoate decarboxylase
VIGAAPADNETADLILHHDKIECYAPTMTTKTSPATCECCSDINRRTFLKTTASSLALAASGSLPLLANQHAKGPILKKGTSETLVATLYKSLTESQRQAVVFPFDHPLRSKVDNNWHITKQKVADFFTPDQQAMIREIFLKMHSPEYADRVMKQPGGGKALLFEQPILLNGERSEIPVAINLFGSMRRMSLSLGVDSLDDVGARITELLAMKVPEGLIAKLSMLPRLLEVGKFPPRMRRGDPPCQEVVWQGEQVNLDRLPLIKCWPEDGGAYITFPMVITRDPKRGIRNVGMYRIMQTGKSTLAMHWQRHKVGAAHWREMAERRFISRFQTSSSARWRRLRNCGRTPI